MKTNVTSKPILQARSDGCNQLKMTVDPVVRKALRDLERFTSDCLGVRCSLSVLLRRAALAYRQQIIHKLTQGPKESLPELANWMHKERDLLYEAAGRKENR